MPSGMAMSSDTSMVMPIKYDGVQQANADLLQDGLACPVGKTKVAAQDAFAGAGRVRNVVAVRVHLGPVIARQPVDVLHGQRFVEPELSFEDLHLFWADALAPICR